MNVNELTDDDRTAELALTVVEDTLDAWQELARRDLAEKHFGDRSVTGDLRPHEGTAIVDMHPCLGALNALGVGDDPGRVPSPEAVESLAEDLAQVNRILNERTAPLDEARELAERLAEFDEDDESEQVSTDEALEAVEDAKGVRSSVLSNNTTARRATDGRVVVQFSTSHGYGRSNGLDALRELDDSFAMAYNPHGATQWAAQTGEGMSRDEAEAFVQVGAEYVSVRGYHVEITGVSSGTGSVEADYPESSIGDSRGEPRRERLVEQLVKGTATPLNSDDVLGEDEAETDGGTTQGRVVATDGGFEFAESVEELHEDGYDTQVLDELATIRDTGLTNMNNLERVRYVADECGFEKTAALLERRERRRRAEVILEYLREMGKREAEDGSKE